jgi:Cdc6-like AAA superfamily ATPase
MPFPQTEETLNNLILRVLTDPNESEIQAGLQQAKLQDREIYDLINGNAKEIWESVTTEITKFNEREAQLDTSNIVITGKLGPKPSTGNVEPSAWVMGPGCLILVLYAVAFFVVNKDETWTATFSSANWVWFIGIVVMLVLLGAASVWAEARQSRKLIRTESIWEDYRRELLTRYEIASLRSRLESSQELIEKEILEKKIKPLLRELINSRLTPSYATELEISEAKGLAEIFDPQFVIDTSARKSLRFMLENMPGGSIGIAGPRGSGKSTLLRLFCGPKRILRELKGKPVLAVLVSAPVAYQPRDFILHLFSSLCRSVLEAQGLKYAIAAPQSEEFGNQPPVTPVAKSLELLPRVCFVLGAILLVISLAGAALLTTIPPPPKQQETRSAQDGNPQPESRVVRFVGALELKPGTILSWGILFLVIGGAMAPIFDRDHFFAVGRGIKAFFQRDRLLSMLKRWLPKKASELPAPKINPEPQIVNQPPTNSLQAEARDWLKRIKFQQSYTSGWSGSFKLPVGLEGGLNNAVTFAENQLSLPEIVAFFTEFVEQLSENYQVIIGIDELDKLESDEKAEQFLNDLKSVFGLERCFYLVTVSENAMSNFERRGLPFRDIFDSSFDNVVYVDYLNFESTKTLLEQRVVGRPISFFGLSYSLSGGLARDLIREFRRIIEIRQSGINDLYSICQTLVRADLKAQVRATAISAKKIDLEPEVDLFVESIYKLEDELTGEEALLKAAWNLLPDYLNSKTPLNGDDLSDPKRKELSTLREEMATYLYYAITILQFFNDVLTETTLTTTDQSGSLDNLVRARQVIAVNPAISRAIINQFRNAHKLRLWGPAA